MFPKVLILTLLIFGTFAKDSNKNVEERIEALERKLAALTMTDEMEDIETNRGGFDNYVSSDFPLLFLYKNISFLAGKICEIHCQSSN